MKDLLALMSSVNALTVRVETNALVVNQKRSSVILVVTSRKPRKRRLKKIQLRSPENKLIKIFLQRFPDSLMSWKTLQLQLGSSNAPLLLSSKSLTLTL